jgi:uncharacterized membrane protein YvbJ
MGNEERKGINKKMNLSFTPAHIIILVLLIAVVALGFLLLNNPNAIQESLDRTSGGTSNVDVAPPIRDVVDVSNDEEANTALTDIASDIKGLTSTLDDLDESLT